jgi:hypothetical protein
MTGVLRWVSLRGPRLNPQSDEISGRSGYCPPLRSTFWVGIS